MPPAPQTGVTIRGAGWGGGVGAGLWQGSPGLHAEESGWDTCLCATPELEHFMTGDERWTVHPFPNICDVRNR